ncbi:MAG: DMT family transporter [Clostridiales bacterium]|nr:DMT family transporter [Clostridiales bacterium]
MVINTEKRNAVLGRVALLFTTLIWGTSFVVLKNTLDEVPAMYILAFRFTGAALLMLIISAKDLRKLDKKLVADGAFLGFFLFAGYTIQTFGLYYTTPSKNAFLTASYCVLVPFVSWVVHKNRPDKYNVAAALICLAGVGLVSLKNDYSVEFGDLLTLCCGFFYAVHIVMTAKYVKGRSVALLSMLQFAAAGVLSWGLALLTKPFPAHISSGNIWSIAYLCVMCTAVCFVLQTFGQKHTPPSTVAIIMTLESVFGAAFSVMINHEVLTAKLIAGFALIFAAVLICEIKPETLNLRKSEKRERENTETEPRLFE